MVVLHSEMIQREVKFIGKLTTKKMLWRILGHMKTPPMMQSIILKSTNVDSNFKNPIMWILRLKSITMDPS